MSSPYKKLKLTNQGWVGFTNISKLEPNKAYKMLGITETNHAQYGPGQQATIQAHDGKKWRTQLPGKYLAQLTQDDITTMKKDIMEKKNIFLVFREKMIDNSYRIDISENDSWCVNFKEFADVPELEVSIEENKDEATDNSLEKKEGEANDNLLGKEGEATDNSREKKGDANDNLLGKEGEATDNLLEKKGDGNDNLDTEC